MTGFTRVQHRVHPLSPIRHWLDTVDVHDPKVAHRICRLIPAQCPLARDIKLWSDHILHIPPLCKLNPLYEELIGLRFRALCYLADECHQDITGYI
ncbi:MAG: nitrogenase [Cyanobacteria bacterium CRU_2_1]|nr:nitrogenase [Cyanobacteria bacterium RU_5_0]NJR60539.1 nitrogenase [Cyanobacteria bacterium CRU_2_1]